MNLAQNTCKIQLAWKKNWPGPCVVCACKSYSALLLWGSRMVSNGLEHIQYKVLVEHHPHLFKLKQEHRHKEFSIDFYTFESILFNSPNLDQKVVVSLLRLAWKFRKVCTSFSSSTKNKIRISVWSLKNFMYLNLSAISNLGEMFWEKCVHRD